MKTLGFAAALALLVSAGASAQQDVFPDVIGGQIDAFLADDVETAFGFAAPGIQSMFGTPGNFGRMVQQGYPMVWRPESVDYLGAQLTQRGWMQEILVTDTDGRLHKLAYLMVETPMGWKIGGVQVLTGADAGA